MGAGELHGDDSHMYMQQEPVGACRSLSEPVAACRSLSQPVGACRSLSEPVGACRSLSEPVGACRSQVLSTHALDMLDMQVALVSGGRQN